MISTRRHVLSRALRLQQQHQRTLRQNANSSRRTTTTTTTKSNASPIKKKQQQQQQQHEPHDRPKAFAVGTFAGVLGSLAGMGGGFVMIPLMTSSLLKLSQHQAHGTSLFAVAATGVAGALGYYSKQGVVDFEAAAAIAACGMVTARMGAGMTTKLSGPALKRGLGIFMICVAPMVPAKAYLMDMDDTNKSSSAEKKDNETSMMHRLAPPAVIGCFSGFLAGLFGVGGGAIVVPALTLATDMTHYQALGTSLCAMALPALSGTYTHYTKNNVAMRIAPALAAGAFVGAYVGGKWIGLNMEESTLRWGFSGLMVVLGVRTLTKL